MSLNVVTLMGNLTAVPELKFSSAGNAFTIFRIAVNEYNGKTQTQTVDFINCVAFGKTAEFLCQYFTKGSPVAVEGSLHQNDYTDAKGINHYSYQVTVNRIHFVGRKADNPAAAASVQSITPTVQPTTTAQSAPVTKKPMASLKDIFDDPQQDNIIFQNEDFELLGDLS